MTTQERPDRVKKIEDFIIEGLERGLEKEPNPDLVKAIKKIKDEAEKEYFEAKEEVKRVNTKEHLSVL